MLLTIRVQPNAKQNQILQWDGKSLKIKIAAPPVDGKANLELIRFLSEKLNLPPSSLKILSGHTSKQKRLELPLSEAQLIDRLGLKMQSSLL